MVNFTLKTDIAWIMKRWVLHRFFQWNLLCNSAVWQYFFSWTAWVWKENKHNLSERADVKGKKAISESTVNCQLSRHKNNFVSSRSKKSFTGVLYSTLTLKTRSFTFWYLLLKHTRLPWYKNRQNTAMQPRKDELQTRCAPTAIFKSRNGERGTGNL